MVSLFIKIEYSLHALQSFQLAEGESQALSRKLVLEEAEFERTESTLVTITAELTEKSNLADTINKAIKVLETKNMIDEESKQKISYPSFLFRMSKCQCLSIKT